ncbi:MAG: SEC-C domain-containing protein [Firmicutes bacterium]|nr:SEC-C domain-containing protein [Bacillota bacterium]MBR1989211.1 SEC-C domain-containing protein [Bacillota bacterium]MBR3705948.1 SEC-C domain-containing protein [Bacillota bacterium]
MTLYKQWVELMESQTDESFEEFWEEYSGAESKLYAHILENADQHFTGKVGELAAKFEVRPVIFMGFLDGINTSLVTANDLETITEETEIDLDIDMEKLFFNMLKADADYLYTLPQWDGVLSEEKRLSILKDYNRSRIVVKEKEPGRNDPCPCGSGKKYKKCCGANK